MKAPPIPEDEATRLTSLRSLNILYTPAEESFDRITRLAALTLGVPAAVVNLVGPNEVWPKSARGHTGGANPRDLSICGHAILDDEPLVIEDAAADPRFADNPFVVSGPAIRFYAGQAIHAADGSRIGTLCVTDSSPRTFTPENIATLRDLAILVESEIHRRTLSEAQATLLREHDELQRKALIDGLTAMWNRSAIMEALEREIARANRGAPASIAMIDIDFFKQINDTHGHLSGDAVLREVASRVRGSGRGQDIFGRYGGEEFLAILSDCDRASAKVVAERIRRNVAERPVQGAIGPLQVTVSIGVATYDAPLKSASSVETSMSELVLAAADAALYEAKNGGRNLVAYAV